MGAFSESSFADLAHEFNGNGVKSARLVWHAFLRASKPETVMPSKFADFSRHIVSLLPLKAPLPAFRKPAPIFLSDITRFAKPRPVAVPQAVEAPALIVTAPVVEVVVPVIVKKAIDFAKAARRAQSAQVSAVNLDVVALENVVAKIIANENIEAVVVAEAKAGELPQRKTLSLKAKVELPAADAPRAEVKAEEQPRKTLSLKTRVELPPIAPVSTKASASDLAAAFKAEMKLMTEQQQKPEAVRPAPAPKYRSKSWSDMIAEAEKPVAEKKWGVDLASAFKRELQAVISDVPDAAAPVPSAALAKPRFAA